MIKKKLLILIFTLSLLICIISLTQMESVEANFAPSPDTIITLQLPRHTTLSASLPFEIVVFPSNSVELIFTMETNIRLVYCFSLDTQERTQVNATLVAHRTESQEGGGVFSYTRYTEKVTIDFSGLSEGAHILTFYQVWDQPYGQVESTKTIHFAIDDTIPSPSSTIATSPIVKQQPETSPAPSSATEPTSTPKPSSGFLGASLPIEYGYAIAAVLVIIVVAGLSVVYFRRLKNKPQVQT
jgi:hypothetical protein